MTMLLLEIKAEINLKIKLGRTPLHLAAAEGQKAMVRLLLDWKAQVSLTDDQGMISLALAIERNHKGVVKLLKDYMEKHPSLPTRSHDGL